MTAPAESDARLREVLRAACGEVREDPDGVLAVDSYGNEIDGHAALLEEAVLAALRGAAVGELPQSHLARRVLQQIRAALVRGFARLDPAPGSTEILHYLSAFEAVAQAMETGWQQRFGDRLSGPDGPALVVEVAHDLRSPLTSILFLAETLRRGRSGPLTSLQDRQLGLIYAAAFGLTSVASDIIELARGGDRQFELDPLPFSVADITESVRDMVQPIAEEKGLEVRLVVGQEPLRMGYPVALSRVLLNLTTNALKFTDEGYVEVKVESCGPNELEFSVRDTGRGVPAASMSMLFEPFRRRQRDREYAFSGSGLGLSICRKLVEAMHSELKVSTAAGQGTKFFFVLSLPPVESSGDTLG